MEVSRISGVIITPEYNECRNLHCLLLYSVEGGLVQDALVDLTRGASEEIDMRSAQAQIDLASGRLWSQLLRFKQEGFLLGVGSPSGSDVHISSSGIVGMLTQYCR
ncbi:hypothetical protein Pint_32990 [Pistacia integerrima]|uniref:Uncharacterized protein n=1 Tax=Pistacia integerrima TaxID=434235 RepID=A0ACC0X6B8_9ROSI|nr:hypothetical protein Pint_32990 [Pistacia integerrima]